MFCPHCGNETDLVIGGPAVTEATIDREVEIARINAERDIKVAQIQARQEKDWNETRVEETKIEADAGVAAAVAEAEIIGAALEASDTPEPAPEPIEIVAPDVADDLEPDDAPPPADDAPAPAAPSKGRGLGMW